MGVMLVLKLIHVYLLASVKYFLTFPYALLIGLNYAQTIAVVLIGGISGFSFYYYLSGFLIRFYHQYRQRILCVASTFFRVDLCRWHVRKIARKSPSFNKRSRALVRLKTRYGFWGIIIMTPVLLSIPVGAFLLNRYYPKQKNILAYMMISLVGWALVFSSVVAIFPKMV